MALGGELQHKSIQHHEAVEQHSEMFDSFHSQCELQQQQ
jgi:hypothetical protein